MCTPKTCMKFKVYFILDTELTSLDGLNPHGYITHKWVLLLLKVNSPLSMKVLWFSFWEPSQKLNVLVLYGSHKSSELWYSLVSLLFFHLGTEQNAAPQLLSNTFLLPALGVPVPKCQSPLPACSPISAWKPYFCNWIFARWMHSCKRPWGQDLWFRNSHVRCHRVYIPSQYIIFQSFPSQVL